MTNEPAPGLSRQLARLGCLLPVLTTAVFVMIFLWPHDRHQQASDFEAVAFFISFSLVPTSVFAGIVLAILAVQRVRRERLDGGMSKPTPRLVPLLAAVAAIAFVALTTGLIWIALIGLGRFR